MKIYFLLFFIGIFSCRAQERKEVLYPDGNVKKVYHLNEAGQKEGKEIFYYSNGEEKKIILWDAGKLKDSIINYTRKGTIYSVGHIKKDSLIFYRTADSTKEFEVALEKGRKEGTGIYYDNAGNIIGLQEFKGGEKDGFFISLNEENKTKNILEYNNGEPNGLLIDFYSNGQIKSLRTADIFHNGISIKYFSNGVLREWVNTLKGKAEGWKFIFNEKGVLISKVFYNKGQIIKEVTIK